MSSTTRLDPPYETNGSGNPGERRDPERGREVDGCLPADERRDARGEQLPERILAAHGDAEAGDREQRERADHERRADQPELLADDREDHVRVRLREVRDLPDALAEAGAR